MTRVISVVVHNIPGGDTDCCDNDEGLWGHMLVIGGWMGFICILFIIGLNNEKGICPAHTLWIILCFTFIIYKFCTFTSLSQIFRNTVTLCGGLTFQLLLQIFTPDHFKATTANHHHSPQLPQYNTLLLLLPATTLMMMVINTFAG